MSWFCVHFFNIAPKYVATRPNAEKFEVNQSQTEATEHQKKWIEKELKAHKELKESCEQEYEDYLDYSQ